MTRAAKFKQRDVKAAIKGAHGAGVTVERVKITSDGEISVKLKLTPATPPTATELDDEVAEWNKLIEADDGRGKAGR